MIAREAQRVRRHRRLRKRVAGLPERPRLAVYRSHKHLYAQVINDVESRTLFTCSTQQEELKAQKRGGTVNAAQELGRAVAQEAIKRGIKRVVFDRGGYQYHGRIKALADAARQGGLEF